MWGKIVRINILLTAIISLVYGVVVFLSVYLAQDSMRTLVSLMPSWLTHGFEIAGGILPAVGFAMLLKVLLKKELFPLSLDRISASGLHAI